MKNEIAALSNKEAEKSILGAILLDQETAAPVFVQLRPEDFFHECNREIYRAMLSLRNQGIPIDLVTVKDRLEQTIGLEKAGGAVYLPTLTDGLPRALNITFYADIILKKSRLRKILAATNQARIAVLEGDGQGNVEEISRRLIEELGAGTTEKRFQALPHWVMRDVADVASWPCEPIQWIIRDIAARGNLIWVSADTQTGKTLIGLYNALQIIKGGKLYGQFTVNPARRILYFVLEDPDRRIKDRILDILHNETVGIDRDRFIAYFASGLNIGENDQLDYLDSLMAQFDVVYLDSYQRATPGILSFDDAKQSLIIHRLASMTRKYNNVLFVHDHFRVASETRGKRRQDPDKSRTKGTGGKIQNADCVISMDKENDKIRVKVESKENSSVKFFMLQVSPKGSAEEKFKFVGDLEQMGSDMAAVGQANKEKVYEAIPANGEISAAELATKVPTIKPRTVQTHLKSLIADGRVATNGKKGYSIMYLRARSFTQEKSAACAKAVTQEELYV